MKRRDNDVKTDGKARKHGLYLDKMWNFYIIDDM